MPTTNITDQIIFCLQAQTTLIHLCAALRSIQRNIQPLCFSKTGEGGGGAYRVARIGVAMPDCGLAGFIMLEQRGNLLRHHHRPKRKIAVGDGLCRAGKIGLHAPMARPGPGPGSSEGCNYLVSD